MMTFDYDVFLSYSFKDRQTARALAKRLKAGGLNITWNKKNLERSRTFLMCMSPAYFKSEWVKLEHHTLLFRDPTDAQRRFIPLLIVDCDPPDVIAQFRYVDWRTPSDEAYAGLLDACQGEEVETTEAVGQEERVDQARMVLEGHTGSVFGVVVTPDGKTVVSASADKTLKVWDLETGGCHATFQGHTKFVGNVVVTPDGKTVVSASEDKTLKVWDLATGHCRVTFEGHAGFARGMVVTPDGKTVVSASADQTLKVWDLETGECRATFQGHSLGLWNVVITPDGKTVVSASSDKTLKVWDLETGQCHATLKNHTNFVRSVAVTPDGKTVVSGSDDETLRVWDLTTGQYRATFEGHTERVHDVIVTPDGKTVVSGSKDETLRVWDLATGQCRATLKGHTLSVFAVAITPNGKTIVSASKDSTLRVWDLPQPDTIADPPDTPRYTNAKVVLVGESGVGKTGLALRLAEDRWQETGSTHGMNVWPLPLPGPLPGGEGEERGGGVEREVWLWDFAGQPDYRLIHQLYMDETALALMVIDPQRDDPFEPLGHWEKALRAAVKHDPARLLVAARCDRGGLTISQGRVDQYRREHGYSACLDTAAKTGDGCADLKNAIAACIPWERLPWTATTRLFKTLKDAIIRIKAEGVVLARISELGQRLRLELQDETIEEDKLRAVIGLLAGQGLIQKLDFGDFVLLQPEQINNYGSAVVRSARESTDELGVVPERAVLEAELDFKDMQRLDEADEKILLRAMLQTFLDRSLCARVETEQGAQLVFPSYFKLDRPDIPDQPNVVVTYGFAGTLDEIYSTLVVRLHYTAPFEMGELWRYAADFQTMGDKRVGLQMSKQKGDAAEIQVYFGPGTHLDTQVAFIKYIHEHLRKHAQDVTRVRSYVCPYCDTPLENRQAIKKRLELGKTDILCGMCEKRVELIDLIEQKFTSGRFVRAVQEMDAQAQINLDSESRELILVGHAGATATEAGQFFRPVSLAEWGIDGEIEFKDDRGRPGGRRVYLQLKTGDAYHHRRERDDVEAFTIKDPRQAEYWLAQASPVMLVTRAANGQIRWMNVTDHLRGRGTAAWQAKLTELRKTLAKRFDAEELRTFCFDLGVSYDDLPAQGNAGKASELVGYMERRNRIPELEETGRQLRPDISWGDAAPVAPARSQPIIFAGEPFTALNVVRLRSRVLDET